jgi:hypothetical protein
MHYTVYQVTNKTNGKIYIGAHKTKKLDDGYMGSGKHLLRSQEKYGIENFEKEILHMFNSSEDMYKKEKELVDESFIKRKDTYNIKLGGSGGFDHLKDYMGSEDHLKQIRGVQPKGTIGSIKKQKYLRENDPAWCAKSSKNRSIGIKKAYENGFQGSFKNRTHSQETKLKMKESAKGKHIGEKNSQHGTMWITDGLTNRKINKNEIIPVKWIKGRIIKYKNRKILKGKDASNYGKICITNGKKNKYIEKQDIIPEGWGKGIAKRNKPVKNKDHRYLKGKDHPLYGTRYITNGIDSLRIKEGDNIPDGWRLGFTKIFNKNQIIHSGEKHSQYGTIWITDGIETKKIKKNDKIPFGWNRGRKIK